jgi:DNA mismatch repair protein MutS
VTEELHERGRGAKVIFATHYHELTGLADRLPRVRNFHVAVKEWNDEIGRGTATFDGLSLAWAVAEYLASNPKARPKTIFATHYHELTDLADALPSVANFHVVVREWKDDIVFLRKVTAGRSDRSYGIQVARLAGLPPSVVARAREILNGLERDELSRGGRPALSAEGVQTRQLGLFQAPEAPAHPVVTRVRDLDLDNLTPLQALTLLADLKREASE